MFTGIIEETGKVISIIKTGSSAKIKIGCEKVIENTALGDSIAVNGVCLTAVSIGSNYFEADISSETLNKSSLSSVNIGAFVNLERALTLSTRLGGHLVQGHIEGAGVLNKIIKSGEFYNITVSYPNELDKYIVEKGSIAIDGISLTVVNVVNKSFSVAVIPHTFENTNLKYKKNGDIVNLETDILARYVEKMIKHHIYPSSLISSPDVSKKAIDRFYRKMDEDTLDVIILAKADRKSALGVEITKEIVNNNINSTVCI